MQLFNFLIKFQLHLVWWSLSSEPTGTTAAFGPFVSEMEQKMIGILQNTCVNPTIADQNVCGSSPTENIRLDLIL